MTQTTPQTTCSETTPASATSRCGLFEILGIGVLLAAILVGIILASQPRILMARLFWQDEQFTYFLASDPGLGHSMQALRGGADTNPPMLHLMLRAWSAVVPGRPEVVYRSFILLCLWMSLLATYAILRRSFGALPSLAGVLVLCAHPLVIKHAFDARFYVPLLAFSALFAWALGAQWNRRTWLRGTLIALSAAVLCTTHYFGIVSLALIAAGHLALDPLPWRAKLKRLAPAAAGPLALAACAPFYLGQKSGLPVSTWVPPQPIGDYLAGFLPAAAIAVLLAFWWCQQLLRDWKEGSGESGQWAVSSGQSNSIRDPRNPKPDLLPQAALTALFALPLVLIVFSHLVQPAMIPKYGIATVLALCPAVAMLMSRVTRGLASVAVLSLCALALINTRQYVWQDRHPWELAQRQMLADARSAARQGIPIVSMSRRDAYMIYYAAPDLRPYVHILDLRPVLNNPAVRQEDFAAHLLFETEFAEKCEKYYPVPRLISLKELQTMGRFRLIDWEPWQALFKRHVPLRDHGDGTYELAG